MEQLIFFAVIVFFSIIESVARKRKAEKAGESTGGVPPELTDELERRFSWAQQPVEDLPTFDSDPSYDEGPSYDSGPSYDDEPSHDDRMTGRTARGQHAPSLEPAGSGGFLQELAGIAAKLEEERQRYAAEQERQAALDRTAQSEARERAATLTLAKQSPPLPQPMSRGLSVRGTRPEHLVHRAHAEYGTDPSERAASEQDGLDPLLETLSADARAVRLQLMSHSESSLRQALILREVLGPPVALRDD